MSDSSNPSEPQLTPLLPENMAPLFSQRPLYWYEDKAAYDAHLGQVIASLDPRDGIEHHLAKTYADACWEVSRTIALINDAICAAVPQAVKQLIAETQGSSIFPNEDEARHQEVITFVRQALYVRGNKRVFRKFLEDWGIPDALLQWTAFQSALPMIDQLNSMREAAEQRKDKALCRFEQRRRVFESHRSLTATARSNAERACPPRIEDKP